MSQYPNPYQPQQPYQPPQYATGYYYGHQDPIAPLLGPAKRAGILMFVFAGLSLLCGLCFGGFAFVDIGAMQGVPPEQVSELRRMEAEMGVSLQVLMAVMAGFLLVPGVLFLIMGFFVRGGGMGASITGLVLAVIVGLLVLLNLVTSLPEVARNPQAGLGICLMAVPLALLVLMVVWLIQAIRNAPKIADLRLGVQGQYLHSTHQAQMYQHRGYHPQQMQPPPPPPPGSSSTSGQGGWTPPPPPPPAQ